MKKVEIKYDIEREIGTLKREEDAQGWEKKLTKIRWNDSTVAKYDIRGWDKSMKRMSKGITLSEKEMRSLYELLKKEFKE